MALVLLDGTSAATDFAVTLSGMTASSYKCVASFLSATFQRQFTSKETFCTGGWIAETPGMKQMIGIMRGFSSSGSAISDPSVLFNQQTPAAFTFTADTGCTFVGTLLVGSDGAELTAAANSARTMNWRSSGPVTTAWVVA